MSERLFGKPFAEFFCVPLFIAQDVFEQATGGGILLADHDNDLAIARDGDTLGDRASCKVMLSIFTSRHLMTCAWESIVSVQPTHLARPR